MDPEKDLIAYKVLYSGMVQGVGFRYTARRIAVNYNITGYVKNLMNGKVEILVEGAKEEVERFLVGISKSFQDYITKVEKTEVPEKGEYDNFEISF